MINDLKDIEDKVLKDLIHNAEWNSVFVDYEKPHVERVWTTLEDGRRISLHVIHPCKQDESLVHPHPWPAAFHVLSQPGSVYGHSLYVMHSFDSNNDNLFECICSQEIIGDMYYEMLSPNSIHSVTPINGPVYTIMLSGDVIWSENSIKPPYKLSPLNIKRKKEILNIFESLLFW